MSTHNICFYGELTKIIFQLSPDTQHMILWRTDENYLSIIIRYPTYVFMEKRQKLSFNYHQIPSLSVLRSHRITFYLKTLTVEALLFLSPRV